MYSVYIMSSLLLLVLGCEAPEWRANGLRAPVVNERPGELSWDSTWLRVDTKDQDFSVLLPAEPEVYTRPGGFSFKAGGELIKSARRGLAYKGGVFISIEIYETSAPRIALQELLAGARHPKAAKRELVVNGYKGKEFTYEGEAAETVYRYFATNKRIYVIEAVARDADNVSLRYSLNSLRLGGAPPADDKVPPEVEAALDDYTPLPPARVFRADEVDKKAVLLWVPDPIYTRFSSLAKIAGPVKVSMVLTANGEVADVEVMSGATGVLAEMVAGAVKATKFLPAEKNGRPVSQRVTLSPDFSTR